MTGDPLITAVLLGSARSPTLPPAPDPSLDEVWQAIPQENPAAALLHALSLTRCLQRAGAKSQPVSTAPSTLPCPQETGAPLPPAAIDTARRLLAGEFAEFLPEWLRLATAAGKVLPARVLPDFLTAATKNPTLRAAVPTLAGERGFWIARRHPEFSWLLESSTSEENAWDEGAPAERLAWLRQTRAADPARAANAIVSHWKDEDAGMRESILRLVAIQPEPCDEEWLENLALKDRRQEIREPAAAALVSLPDSAFRHRALERVRGSVRIERRLLRRNLILEPPAAFNPAWAADGIREKPPQGTGEKAWWLRQIIAQIPLDELPELLGIDSAALFTLPVDPDWRDTLIFGWIDSSTRLPLRSLPDHFLPFLATLDPRPVSIPPRETLIAPLITRLPMEERFLHLDRIAAHLPAPAMLEVLIHCASCPTPGTGRASLAVIDAAIPVLFRSLTRPQARALAACIPADGIQPRLEAISRLKEVPTAIETFATAIEFRRSLIQSLV